MATLQKIRDKGGVLVAVVIGASLLAFILGDFLGQGGSMGSNSQNVGEVKGTTVTYQEYQYKVDELIETTKRNNGTDNVDTKTMESIYDQAWEAIVLKYTMHDEYAALGLSVSPEELEDMIKGKNIDPQVQQIPIFQDPQTKAFDKSRVISFLKNLDQDPSGVARSSWLAFEQALVQNKVATKYNTLIQKAYYANQLEVENQVNAKNESTDLEFVYKKYAEVKDDEISFTDADLKKYYEENQSKFKQDPSRDITYVTFDIKPSEQDAIDTRKKLEENKEDFANETDAIRYIRYNSDEDFQDIFYAQGELPAHLDTFMFAADTGAISNIYEEGNAYKIAKLIGIKELPDSAEARHILLQASEEMPVQVVVALSDSIQELLKNGADFAELAQKYSKDGGSAVKGGDLGWFQKGQMVAPFQKACFEAEKGDVVVAESQFGLHIIEVQDLGVKNKNIQLGYLTSNIVPSEQTITSIYNDASSFAGKNRTKEAFDASVEELKLVPRVANNLKKTDRNIAGLESPRQLIRWAFNNEVNTVSETIFEFGDKYVVAVLTEAREKGIATFEQAKNEIENYVIKDKKAELIIEEFNNAKADNLNTMAQTLGLKVQNANKISLNSFSIPGAGAEPEVIATALFGAPNTVISPLKGTNGVFAIKTADNKNEDLAKVEDEKNRLSKEFNNRVGYQAIKAVRGNANIVDDRINYN